MIPNPWLPLCGSPDLDFLEFTMGEVKKIAEHALKEHNAKMPGESLMPMLVGAIKTANGEDGMAIVFIRSDFNTKQQKRKGLQRMAQELFKQDCYPGAIYLINDAWGCKPTPGDTRAPRQRDDRWECVIIQGETVGGEGLSSQLRYERDDDKQPVLKGWHEMKEKAMAPREGIDLDKLSRLDTLPDEERKQFLKDWFDSPLAAFWDEYKKLATTASGRN